MSVYKSVKNQALSTLKGLGAFRWMANSQWRSERLLILCYHGISQEDEHLWRPDTYLTPAHFASRLQMLKDGGYNVLPLQDAVQKLYAGKLPPKSVAITFDDGLYNFYSQAVPILNKFGFPATLYLTTYYSMKPLPVFPLLVSYLFWKGKGAVVSENPALGLKEAPNLSTVPGRDRARDSVVIYAQEKGLNADQKNDLAIQLARYLGVDFEAISRKRLFHLINPEEARELTQQGVDIQLHTHRHRTPMDGELFKKEVVENRDKIEELIGKRVSHFCYPSGVCRMHYLPILKALSVTSATTCVHAMASASMDPLRLPRFLDSANVSALNFESWLAGISAVVPRRHRS